MRIYIDESGTLVGLEDPYFVLAALILNDNLEIVRCMKNIRRKKLKKKYKKTAELKFHDSDDNIKRRIIECIGRTNNDICYAVLHKHEAPKVEPQTIYNDACKKLVYGVINNYRVSGQVEIFIDRFLFGTQRTEFDAYMADMTGMIVPATLGAVKVIHADSKACPYIQAVDFIAGAVNRKYRDGNDLFYQKIQNRISLRLEL